ncbi:Protein kinase domain containing protein [Achlya hypogyna]|uniref:Protein kinase domain containing protein n=1 Tax=Achlya hypogyna TaxID=1202772 RepID=A0A1V9YRK1_ACHHY|nr:Protein kinase domain containing protein [Achlya hypogyna]
MSRASVVAVRHAAPLISAPRPALKPRPQSGSAVRRQTPQQLRQLAAKARSPSSLGSLPGPSKRPPTAPEGRLLAGYAKIKKLGTGGFGTVWEVAEAATDARYALKQIPKDDALTSSAVVSAIVEARVGKKLFPQTVVVGDHLGSLVAPSAASEAATAPEATRYIAQLYRVVETKHDIWLLFEQGGDTLHNALFEIKGDFHQGSRTYKIVHRPLYLAMRENVCILKALLRQLIGSVQTLGEHHLVHADIKPDNILVSHDILNGKMQVRTKLIDFGSAFSSRSPRLSSATTPEYVPPDILELLRIKQNANHVKVYFEEHCAPHAFDMWSVGCVFLEIACGVPIWFSFKSRVEGTAQWVTGLMSAQGRRPDKIAQRQLYVAENVEKCIRAFPGMNIDSKRWTHGVALLQRMLDVSPTQRISPLEALAHPFLYQA